MAERFFEVDKISFSHDNLHVEGVVHNKSLHLTVKCECYYVKRVMLDGRSGVDMCPSQRSRGWKSVQKEFWLTMSVYEPSMGVKRDTIGEIDLVLNIGPVDFEVTFQVLDMETSYNFLLDRLWIHAAGAVPSTLHQMVKFEYDNQEIFVHEKDEQSMYWDP
ncbi:uncharacterized protein [Nicotiana tomentosiformis]|uniref:uncharacterized protein n=1 Tax=Nicotiana tomentosiformis TaxID=4098 RepID=UPI00388C6BAF